MKVNFWVNEKLKDIHTFVVFRNLSTFGGKFNSLAVANLMVSFTLVIIILYLQYIHWIKFKDGLILDKIN